MIDLSIYDVLEKEINEKKEEFQKIREMCECADEEPKLGLNALQSIVRSSVAEEQQSDPAYSKISISKGQCESIKFSNLKIDFHTAVALLNGIKEIYVNDKYSIILGMLSIIAELKKVKVVLSPAMGMIVLFLLEHNYTKECEREIEEEKLKKQIKSEFCEKIKKSNYEEEFYKAIDGLCSLGTIQLIEGKVQLIEKAKI